MIERHLLTPLRLPAIAPHLPQTAPLVPRKFLQELTGKAVVIKLKWGMEYRGASFSLAERGASEPFATCAARESAHAY